MSRLLIALCVAALSCKSSAPAKSPQPPEEPASPFAALVAEVDTPAQPVWPTLPAELAAELAKTAAAMGDARARLEHWDFDIGALAPEAIGLKLRAALEGIFLAEPKAYNATPNADGLAAAGLLHHVWNELDTPAFKQWIQTAPNVGVDRKLLELLADAAPAQRRHLAAKVLAAGGPADAVDDVLRALAERARNDGDYTKSRALYAKVVERRGASATLDDWYSLGEASVRVDDKAAAEAALAEMKKRPIEKRLDQAKIREVGKDLVRLDRYVALKATNTIDARVEQFDLLRAMGRSKHAEALLADMKSLAPLDARVRVRTAALAFEGMAQQGQMLQAAGFVAQELGDPALTNKDADYWSMLIGAQGAHAMGEALPLLFQDKVAGGKKMVEILKSIREMAVKLEATRPGRAAALELVLDRAIPIVEKALAQDVAIADLLKGGLDAALALRASHRDTPELDKLVFTFATFTADRQRALDAVMQKLGSPADEEIELYLQRARTALTIAIVMATPKAVDAARSAILEIEPSWSDQIEAHREAMLGDCDAITATVTKDAAMWVSAAQHYEAARAMHREVHARTTNNLGWIALQQGHPEQADALFRESGEDPASERRWLAYLNALATPQRAAERLEGIRSLIVGSSNNGKPPSTLLVWLATTSTDPKEAADAAQKVRDDAADPFNQIKPSNGALGFETEGAFQVGLGMASRKFYDLNANAYASLWLMPPLPALPPPPKPTKAPAKKK